MLSDEKVDDLIHDNGLGFSTASIRRSRFLAREVESAVLAEQAQQELTTVLGMKVIIDPTMPPGEFKIVQDRPVAEIECEEPSDPITWKRAKLNAAGLKLPHGTKLFLYQAIPEGMCLVSKEVIDCFPEINTDNYSEHDVCVLNAWGVELVAAAKEQK